MKKVNLFAVLKQILRVGYVRALIAIDIFLIIILIYDFTKLTRKLGLKGFAYSLSNISKISLFDIKSEFILILSLVIVLPISFCILRILLSRRSKLHGKFAMELSKKSILFHITFSIVFSLSMFPIASMQKYAGLTRIRVLWEDSYKPIFNYVIKSNNTLINHIWIPILLSIVSILLVFFFREAKLSSSMRELLSRLTLIDLRGDLYPEFYNPARANFVGGAISPGIKRVVKMGSKYEERYRKLSPGSRESTKYMFDLGELCVNKSKKILFQAKTKNSFVFTTNTSRALEIFISNIIGSKYVFLSPYEHYSEISTIKWLNRIGIVEYLPIEWDEKILLGNSDEYKDEIINGFIDAIEKAEKKKDSKYIIIISEVCWATGAVIPYKSIINAIKNKIDPMRIITIVDAAHSVGNNRVISDIECADAYIYCGHKWLFSSEPIGIIITDIKWNPPYPVDAWIKNDRDPILLSVGTTNCRRLGHYLSALEMIGEYKFAEYWDRSKELRARLIKSIIEKYVSVGNEYDTENYSFILSIAPNHKYKWSFDGKKDTEEYFNSTGVSVNVFFDKNNNPIFVRTTLPYFMNLRDIDILSKCLNNAVKVK